MFRRKINRSIHQKQTIILLSLDSHLFHSILDNLNKHKYFTSSQILLDMGSNFFVCQPPNLPMHYGCTLVPVWHPNSVVSCHGSRDTVRLCKTLMYVFFIYRIHTTILLVIQILTLMCKYTGFKKFKATHGQHIIL